jgi:hypothetical protein
MKGEPQVPRALTRQDERQPSKGPPRKSVRFFVRSRAQGKGKGREAHAGLKTLKEQRQRGEGRHPRGKSRGQARAGDRARLRTASQALEAAGEAGGKQGGGAWPSAGAARRVCAAARPPSVLVGAEPPV